MHTNGPSSGGILLIEIKLSTAVVKLWFLYLCQCYSYQLSVGIKLSLVRSTLYIPVF